ncbi:MAG TPA: hypothetical protein VOA88_15750 [Candidatus Dormibacteraeota bacterium]|nr:hypothetical protein [Candidatus Dormibacteraeota bacterium]
MKLRLLIFVSAALLSVAAFQFGQGRVHAQAPPPTIPASFGNCVGSVNLGGVEGLIFQGGDGTIRLFNLTTGAVRTIARSTP